MADILIIDDESLIRDSLSNLFRREGYIVAVASNGIDGLRKFTDDPARLVVTDIVMPEMEGIETIRELRARHPGVVIIAISGGGRHGSVQFLEIARKLGADAALAKPFTRAQITGLVREFMQGKAADSTARGM